VFKDTNREYMYGTIYIENSDRSYEDHPFAMTL